MLAANLRDYLYATVEDITIDLFSNIVILKRKKEDNKKKNALFW